MRHYCTISDSARLPRALALHQSLLANDGEFELTVLALDESAAASLCSRSRPKLTVLPLRELIARHPALAAARNDRTSLEFALTCKSWLLRHLLPAIPAGELLSLVEAEVYFFNPPHLAFAEIGTAPVAVIPHLFPAAMAQLENRGKFNAGWVTLRHDATGVACAQDWADRCAQWCFAGPTAGRHPEEMYMDLWPQQFAGTVILNHPGILVAPWNIADRPISSGPAIDGRPLVAFHFGDLEHLGLGVFDPGLSLRGVTLTRELRELVYHPYLDRLASAGNLTDRLDIVPPADSADPRCGIVLAQLLEQSRRAARDRGASEQALAESRAESRRLLEESRDRAAESERYLHQVEQDRDQQRQSFFATRRRLEEVHQDLLHNIAYLKKLEAAASAQQQASVDREAYIASLKDQLAKQHTGHGGPDLASLHLALAPHGRDIRRLLVARYHPALLPTILCLSARGVTIEVLGSPAEFAGETRGSVHFLGGNLWDWLGGLNSFFDADGYLQANPDVAAALAAGAVRSAWDHYLIFGQLEGRATGVANFRAGLADFDAVAFDSADAGPIVPCLIGRLQPHHRLFVSSSFNPATVWLPGDTQRTIVLGDLLCCPRPPSVWLGPRFPSALPAAHRPPPTTAEIYPDAPSQPAAWPKITVVTTSRNQAAKLEATLRSVLDQNYPMLEYLVIDSASSDCSVEIIRRHAERLAWWTSSSWPNPASGLNTGLAKATGNIVAWLNAGDRLAPGSLFTVAQQFLLHAPDMMAGRCIQLAAAGHSSIHRSVLSLGQIQPLPLAELSGSDDFLLRDCFFRQPAVFVSREAFNRAGGRFQESLRQSFPYEYWLRLAHCGARVLPVPEILAVQGEPSPEEVSAWLEELPAARASYQSWVQTPVTV